MIGQTSFDASFHFGFGITARGHLKTKGQRLSRYGLRLEGEGEALKSKHFPSSNVELSRRDDACRLKEHHRETDDNRQHLHMFKLFTLFM